MPVYARNDLLSIVVTRENGGCGTTHERPKATDGIPVKVWGLACSHGCENVLRHDSSWSSTLNGIPETPDEQAVREDHEKRTQADSAAATTEALVELSKLGDLPEALAQLAQIMVTQHTTTAEMVCPEGHRNNVSARFCASCGVPLVVATPAVDTDTSEDAPAPVHADTPHESEAPVHHQIELTAKASVDAAETEERHHVAVPSRQKLEEMNLPALRDLARSLGVKTTRARADQINYILER